MKQWSRVLTTKGVFSGELQLSQSPVLGDWNITVVVMDQYFYKTFQVAEYVLPKFEVTIDAPVHATFKDSHLVATVHAKYDVFLCVVSPSQGLNSYELFPRTI